MDALGVAFLTIDEPPDICVFLGDSMTDLPDNNEEEEEEEDDDDDVSSVTLPLPL